MKNVLYISNHRGFSKFNKEFIEGLSDKNLNIFNASPGTEVDLCSKQIDVKITRAPISLGNFLALLKLVWVIYYFKIDLVHCHTPSGGLVGRCLKLFKPKIKVIYTAHGFHFYKGAKLHNWMIYCPVEIILSLLTDLLIVINNEDYLFARKYLFCKVNKMMGIGINVDKFYILDSRSKKSQRFQMGLEKFDKVLICVAQFVPRKNHTLLVKVFSELLKLQPNLGLVLVGDGYLRKQIVEAVGSLQIDESVVFTGYVSNVYDYYAVSDYLISLSSQEGFGLNLVEGLASGLPAFASNVRGHIDIAGEARSVKLVSLESNVRSLAEDLAQFIERERDPHIVSTEAIKFTRTAAVREFLAIIQRTNWMQNKHG